MAGSLLRKFGRGLALVGLELRVVLFGKQLKSSTTAPTNGQALVYVAADDAWSPGTVSGGALPGGTLGAILRHNGTDYVTYAVGTSGQVLRVSGGTPAWATLAAADVGALAVTDVNAVARLRVGYAGAAALDADHAVGFARASAAIAVRNSGDSAWLDVFRIDGSSLWTYGSSDGGESGGTVVLAPAAGELLLKRAATTHIGIAGSGALTIGTASHTTALQGSALTIGLTSVVAQYQGGARVPERTITTTSTLDAQDEVVFVDTTSAAVTLTLPACSSGRVLTVQRIAGTNSVTMQRAGADTIRAGGSSGLMTWVIADGFRHGLLGRGASEWVAES